MTNPAPFYVRCREIQPTDFDSLVGLLHRGFPDESREHFEHALLRLASHSTPPGFPKYGYALEAAGALVGAILVIFSTIVENGVASVRGNASSWYVEPEFRSYGALLRSRLLSRKDVTFVNLTPARHTWPILALKGYKPFWPGVFAAVPALRPPREHTRVAAYAATLRAGDDLAAFELAVLRDHAGYGCYAVTCTAAGRRHPFVFSPRKLIRWKGVPLPSVVLSYCRDIDDFVRFAGPLGRYLARKGVALVFIEADGPIPSLPGRFLDWGPKFYRGPKPPRVGDLAYTEWVMF